jgi:hypothetical protein
MGLFDQFFKKQPANPSPSKRVAPEVEESIEDFEETRSTAEERIEGPPEFLKAVAQQRAYWTHNAGEQSELESKSPDQLDWKNRLRLHHLICLERLLPGLAETRKAEIDERCRQSTRRLLAPDSPYRPRPALVWQMKSGTAVGQGQLVERDPNHQGVFWNPSLSHFGCIEYFREDPATNAQTVEFADFDHLSGIAFGGSSLLRAMKLFFEDGTAEVVLTPLLYGLTWQIGGPHDRNGSMTRFVRHLDELQTPGLGEPGLGVGQQDFCVMGRENGMTIFGAGSVQEIAFPLDLRDPRFDQKARARGIDPDEVRRSALGRDSSAGTQPPAAESGS